VVARILRATDIGAAEPELTSAPIRRIDGTRRRRPSPRRRVGPILLKHADCVREKGRDDRGRG